MYKHKRDNFKYRLFENAEFSPKFGMPCLNATQLVPTKLVAFNECFRIEHPEEYFVHFYIDDYQFERIWNFPQKYLEILRKFAGVITPDFSLYTDMPKAQQIWNDYRNKLIGYFLQSHKINIIPNVSWSDSESFDFCFEGLPRNSVVSISTNGTMNKISKQYFLAGYKEMIQRLQPTKVLVYGEVIPEIAGENVIHYSSKLEKLKQRRNDNGRKRR